MTAAHLLKWLVALAAVLLILPGCQREEPPPVTPPAPKPPLHVVVPDEVKAKWKAVRIVAYDRQAQRELLYTVDIGGSFVLPETALQVEVVHFLPAFATDGRAATSLSNEPTNPGAEIVVRRDGEEIYRGWLFRAAPDDHGFRHPRYTLSLRDVIVRR